MQRADGASRGSLLAEGAPSALRAAVPALTTGRRGVVAVAYSGGRDSTALLHATLAAAEALDANVVALHVHHGLSEHADTWLAHCEDRCRRWARRGRPIDLVAHRIDVRPAAGDSIEAWARRERYRALRQMALAHGADLVLLAHHRRDQAETFLLQALRGGGVAALSAMPASVRRDGVTWARPWLALPREAIEAYARRHHLRWIDDDSNSDERFARNRLRSQVWPALVGAFPDAEAALATAARWAQRATAAIDEWAADDLAAVSGAAGLDIASWRALSPPRQSQVLRAWLRESLGAPAPASLVERLLAEIGSMSARRWPAGAGELRSYRGRLRWEPASFDATGAAAMTIDLARPGVHELAAWRGAIRVERVERGGLPLAVAARLELRPRAPGDRFQAGPGRPPRSLKLQYQTAAVPAWQRQGPIVYRGEGIVFVPGLGIDARAVAAEGEAQVLLAWVPRC